MQGKEEGVCLGGFWLGYVGIAVPAAGARSSRPGRGGTRGNVGPCEVPVGSRGLFEL